MIADLNSLSNTSPHSKGLVYPRSRIANRLSLHDKRIRRVLSRVAKALTGEFVAIVKGIAPTYCVADMACAMRNLRLVL
jgi:hypothetical protein